MPSQDAYFPLYSYLASELTPFGGTTGFRVVTLPAARAWRPVKVPGHHSRWYFLYASVLSLGKDLAVGRRFPCSRILVLTPPYSGGMGGVEIPPPPEARCEGLLAFLFDGGKPKVNCENSS